MDDSFSFFDRDLSWLSFNERVLLEAAKLSVPLLERIKFLSIYSSNLDEFYRVRMPVLLALHKLNNRNKKINKSLLQEEETYEKANQIIQRQLKLFGTVLTQSLIPQLKEHDIYILYNEPIPDAIQKNIDGYFFNQLAAFIEIVFISKQTAFFLQNNKLYITVILESKNGKEEIAFINVPSDTVPRFFSAVSSGISYIVFIDDIIETHLPFIFPNSTVTGAYSIKITRDAALDLEDEFEGDIAEKIEKQINKRDFGLATRFLYQPGIPLRILQLIADIFSLSTASMVEGGNYHNLKDFASLPVTIPSIEFPKLRAVDYHFGKQHNSLFQEIQNKDLLINTPYQNYNSILRFFNEAAITEDVEEIYVTLYRVANDSKIAYALISAAKNGKKVTVFVELKARFDEANNIRWAKIMKSAGVKIIYSIPELKVHAKVALIKKKKDSRFIYLGLFATGNLNEITARFYTDHILLTANHDLLRELELLFLFLTEREKPNEKNEINFNHLLIAQFNLQQNFLNLIDNEIANTRKGLHAGIIIKLNNLEEEVLISRLYDASNAGVKINLIVRGICRLIPGIKGMSENISVKRIVDKYLEHGRVFIFQNNNNELIYLGSSDWMNRNIYRRIEVCCPIYDEDLKKEIKEIINLQLEDNISAVTLDESMNNIPLKKMDKKCAHRKLFMNI